MKVLYGSKSWMTHLTKEDFTDQNCEANVDVEYIQEAGHHIYADQYKQFNYVLNKFLKSEDWNKRNSCTKFAFYPSSNKLYAFYLSDLKNIFTLIYNKKNVLAILPE